MDNQTEKNQVEVLDVLKELGIEISDAAKEISAEEIFIESYKSKRQY